MHYLRRAKISSVFAFINAVSALDSTFRRTTGSVLDVRRFVQLLLLLSRRRIALQHRPTQQLPQLRLQSLKSRLKKLRRKSILSELIHRSLRKRLSRLLLRRLNQKNFSPKPSIRSTRLSVARSQRLMPAVSKARKTTRFSATSTPATTSVLPATCSQP